MYPFRFSHNPPKKPSKEFENDSALSLGVSICLDVVSMETLDLDTSKSQSRLSRNSWQL